MSFFGLESSLEQDKKKFLEGGLQQTEEDLAVYTWGEESYDGLGDALHEGGDELNDETFGGTGVVGEMQWLFASMQEVVTTSAGTRQRLRFYGLYSPYAHRR
jgi:DNA topoisomerase 2-associated protein PAT1